jgi:hypothetical protein
MEPEDTRSGHRCQAILNVVVIGFTTEAQGFKRDRPAAGKHVEHARPWRATGRDVFKPDLLAGPLELFHPSRLAGSPGLPVGQFRGETVGMSDEDMPLGLLDGSPNCRLFLRLRIARVTT